MRGKKWKERGGRGKLSKVKTFRLIDDTIEVEVGFSFSLLASPSSFLLSPLLLQDEIRCCHELYTQEEEFLQGAAGHIPSFLTVY